MEKKRQIRIDIQCDDFFVADSLRELANAIEGSTSKQDYRKFGNEHYDAYVFKELSSDELEELHNQSLDQIRTWRNAVFQTLKEKGEQKLEIDEDFFEGDDLEDEEKGLVVECLDSHGNLCVTFLRSIRINESGNAEVFVTQWDGKPCHQWMSISYFSNDEADFILYSIDWKES